MTPTQIHTFFCFLILTRTTIIIIVQTTATANKTATTTPTTIHQIWKAGSGGGVTVNAKHKGLYNITVSKWHFGVRFSGNC